MHRRIDIVGLAIILWLVAIEVAFAQSIKQAWVVRSRESLIGACDVGWRLQDVGLDLILTPPTDQDAVIARGLFEDARVKTGFTELTIEADGNGSPSERRYAAGALEGYLTGSLIAQLILNAKSMRIRSVYNQTLAHLVEWQRLIRSRSLDPSMTIGKEAYWANISLVLDRFDGMKAILAHPCSAAKVTEEDLILLQNDGDVGDIEQLYALIENKPKLKQSIFLSLKGKKSTVAEIASNGMATGALKAARNDEHFWQRLLTKSKCSALIRLTSSGNVLLGHATWAYYVEMIRVMKHVSYGDIRTSYSGFAGMIASTDDWYVNGKGLAVTETSLNVIDAKSYEALLDNKFQGVPSWLRTVVAMENAGSAEDWIAIFSEEFSGTYNCQWMILDRKRRNDSSGLFTVYETMPKIMQSQDFTAHLREMGFFSSQNTPIFDSVRAAASYPQTEEQIQRGICKPCQCYYSYDSNPRGCIFKQDGPTVETVEDMKQIMRSNDWQTEPLSLGKPQNAIAGRFDLSPDTASRIPNGAIDAKVLSLFEDEQFASHHVIGAIPVNDQCPPFSAWNLFSGEQDGLVGDGIAGLTGTEEWFRTKRFVL